MEPPHPLKSLLQLQLASDSSAVINLPYVLDTLTSDDFLPSSHLTKWTTRINSLLYSKEAGGRWAGLCLAQKTSVFSKNIMVEFSQSWLGVALPILSRNEPLPTLKSAIRLIRLIFIAGLGTPEFQRQVVTPNVPKFTVTIIGLAEKHHDEELKVLILTSLARLIPLYPTLHRPSHAALSSLSLRFLNGNAPNPTNSSLLEAASRLYAVLHFTGGKVGAANLWRKTLDETLSFLWSAFFSLRTTFPTEGRPPELTTDREPHMSILLNVDRLRCGTVVICDILSATTHRTVNVPLGPLVKFITTLLRCTKDDKQVDYSDPEIRAMEVAVIPDLWKFGCDILSCLAKCVRHHLTPNLTRLISYLTFRLEQDPTSSQRLFFLMTIQEILTYCQPLDSPLAPTRLAKAVLPSITVILSSPSDSQHFGSISVRSSKGKKGRKRARDYEGDEVFKLSREVICPTIDEGKILLTALEVMHLLLRNPHLSPAIHSLTSRILLNILLSLPQMSPASLSPNPRLHTDLCQLVHAICMDIGTGTPSVMSKSLGLVVRSVMIAENNNASLRDLDLMLHPRVPPLVRSLPHVESLSLFHAEESQEEAEARDALGLTYNRALPHPDQSSSIQDVPMVGETSVSPAKHTETPTLQTQTFAGPVPLPSKVPRPPVEQPGVIPKAPVIDSEPSNQIPEPEPKPAPGQNAVPLNNVVQSLAPLLHPISTITSTDEVEDEDAEMPAINLDSDSDGD